MIPNPTVEAPFLPMSSHSFFAYLSGSSRGEPPAASHYPQSLAVPPRCTGIEAEAPDAHSVTAASALEVHGGLVGKVEPFALQIRFGVRLRPLEGIRVVLDFLQRTAKLRVAHKMRGRSLGTREVPRVLVIP